MPAQLATVADYIAEARVLLQDLDAGAYRYSDAELVRALNLGLMEMRRLRPDLFLTTFTVPSYSEGSPATAVALDLMYRSVLIWYIVGRTQLRDEEQTTDARAGTFMTKFVQQLTTVA